ncbi:transposase [Listeria marthii]|nr:transposase [Listeria marthii]MBF2495151.1 transposase [Listeria marthii]
MELIQSICIKHKFRYGYRRVTAELRWKHNPTVNHKKVQQIMHENKLCAKIRKKKFSFFRR